MANEYGTNVGEMFARNTLKQYYEEAVCPKITNQNWEGEFNGMGSKLNVLTFDKLSLKDYTGVALSVDTPTESEATLTIDQKKAYYFQIESFAKFASYVNDPSSGLIEQCGKELAETVDAFVLGFYADVAAGNRVGTDYTTGTVTVDVTTGAVTGSGTTFTSAMVGRGFKATGHTAWYRVKTYSSGTAIVIEDDRDDRTSAYTGGAIGAGATYTIEAATKLQVAKTTIYGYIHQLRKKLNQAKVSKMDRWLVVPAEISAIIMQATEFIPAVESAYNNVVKNASIGRIAGFDVYENEQVSGSNTAGYRVLGGHKSFIAFAMAFTETEVEPFIGGFGKNFKGLNCYGAKVADVNRKAGVEGFWYV